VHRFTPASAVSLVRSVPYAKTTFNLRTRPKPRIDSLPSLPGGGVSGTDTDHAGRSGASMVSSSGGPIGEASGSTVRTKTGRPSGLKAGIRPAV
jgi:hypothetical protein